MSAPGEAKARRARRRASSHEADTQTLPMHGRYKEAAR